jgi:hypothetical protein
MGRQLWMNSHALPVQHLLTVQLTVQAQLVEVLFAMVEAIRFALVEAIGVQVSKVIHSAFGALPKLTKSLTYHFRLMILPRLQL